jgi:hypothetical protein
MFCRWRVRSRARTCDACCVAAKAGRPQAFIKCSGCQNSSGGRCGSSQPAQSLHPTLLRPCQTCCASCADACPAGAPPSPPSAFALHLPVVASFMRFILQIRGAAARARRLPGDCAQQGVGCSGSRAQGCWGGGQMRHGRCISVSLLYLIYVNRRANPLSASLTRERKRCRLQSKACMRKPRGCRRGLQQAVVQRTRCSSGISDASGFHLQTGT